MDRRKFLKAGAAGSAVVIADGALAGTVYTEPMRFALGYHSGLDDGFWMNARMRAFEDVQKRIKLMLLGVQAATAGERAHPVAAFDLELLYKVEGSRDGVLPYRWARLSRNSGLNVSKGITHELEPDQVEGVRVRYELRAARAGQPSEGFEETLAFTDALVPMLTPGFYAIVGPSAATMSPPPWSALAAPGSGPCAVSRCDGKKPDFDAVLIAVEPA